MGVTVGLGTVREMTGSLGALTGSLGALTGSTKGGIAAGSIGGSDNATATMSVLTVVDEFTTDDVDDGKELGRVSRGGVPVGSIDCEVILIGIDDTVLSAV